jgi:hypothetical protein
MKFILQQKIYSIQILQILVIIFPFFMHKERNDLLNVDKLSLIHHQTTTVSNFQWLSCVSDNGIRHGCHSDTVNIKKLKYMGRHGP